MTGGVLVAGVVLAGLLLAVTGQRSGATRAAAATSRASAATGTTPAAQPHDLQQQQLDSVAKAPMAQVQPADGRPAPLTTRTAGPAYVLPKPVDTTQVVPVYGDSIEGAIAQLAAIEEAALRNLDADTAAAVYRWAAMDGATPLADWNPVQLAHRGRAEVEVRGGNPADITAALSVTEAQVKGVVTGGQAAVVCVLGIIDATLTRSIQVAWPDCQRMVWSQGRWRIGPGEEPAYAPFTWPGTEASVRAGWRAVDQHA